MSKPTKSSSSSTYLGDDESKSISSKSSSPGSNNGDSEESESVVSDVPSESDNGDNQSDSDAVSVATDDDTLSTEEEESKQGKGKKEQVRKSLKDRGVAINEDAKATAALILEESIYEEGIYNEEGSVEDDIQSEQEADLEERNDNFPHWILGLIHLQGEIDQSPNFATKEIQEQKKYFIDKIKEEHSFLFTDEQGDDIGDDKFLEEIQAFYRTLLTADNRETSRQITSGSDEKTFMRMLEYQVDEHERGMFINLRDKELSKEKKENVIKKINFFRDLFGEYHKQRLAMGYKPDLMSEYTTEDYRGSGDLEQYILPVKEGEEATEEESRNTYLRDPKDENASLSVQLYERYLQQSAATIANAYKNYKKRKKAQTEEQYSKNAKKNQPETESPWNEEITIEELQKSSYGAYLIPEVVGNTGKAHIDKSGLPHFIYAGPYALEKFEQHLERAGANKSDDKGNFKGLHGEESPKLLSLAVIDDPNPKKRGGKLHCVAIQTERGVSKHFITQQEFQEIRDRAQKEQEEALIKKVIDDRGIDLVEVRSFFRTASAKLKEGIRVIDEEISKQKEVKITLGGRETSLGEILQEREHVQKQREIIDNLRSDRKGELEKEIGDNFFACVILKGNILNELNKIPLTEEKNGLKELLGRWNENSTINEINEIISLLNSFKSSVISDELHVGLVNIFTDRVSIIEDLLELEALEQELIGKANADNIIINDVGNIEELEELLKHYNERLEEIDKPLLNNLEHIRLKNLENIKETLEEENRKFSEILGENFSSVTPHTTAKEGYEFLQNLTGELNKAAAKLEDDQSSQDVIRELSKGIEEPIKNIKEKIAASATNEERRQSRVDAASATSKHLQERVEESIKQNRVNGFSPDEIESFVANNKAFLRSMESENAVKLRKILEIPLPCSYSKEISILRPSGTDNMASVVFNGIPENNIAYMYIAGTDNLFVKVEIAKKDGLQEVFVNGKAELRKVNAGDVIIHERTIFHLNEGKGEYEPLGVDRAGLGIFSRSDLEQKLPNRAEVIKAQYENFGINAMSMVNGQRQASILWGGKVIDRHQLDRKVVVTQKLGKKSEGAGGFDGEELNKQDIILNNVGDDPNSDYRVDGLVGDFHLSVVYDKKGEGHIVVVEKGELVPLTQKFFQDHPNFIESEANAEEVIKKIYKKVEESATGKVVYPTQERQMPSQQVLAGDPILLMSGKKISLVASEISSWDGQKVNYRLTHFQELIDGEPVNIELSKEKLKEHGYARSEEEAGKIYKSLTESKINFVVPIKGGTSIRVEAGKEVDISTEVANYKKAKEEVDTLLSKVKKAMTPSPSPKNPRAVEIGKVTSFVAITPEYTKEAGRGGGRQ